MANSLGFSPPTQFNQRKFATQNPQTQQAQAQQPPVTNDPNGYSSESDWSWQTTPVDQYDERIGNGTLPGGIYGAQNRAYVRDVTGNELVRNQLNGLLDSNSAYMQNARRNGLNVANARGLLNSSLAAQSSQKAAIDAGLPVAQSDAEAYRTAQGQNLQYLNAKQLADMQAASASRAAAAQIAAARIANEGALQRQREQLAYSGEQEGLNRAFTNMRDYYLHNYDLENDASHITNTARSNIWQYGQTTGIDLRVQRNNFYNNLMNHMLDNPDLFPPEVVGGIMQTYLPVQDDFSSYMDDFLNERFGGYGF